MAKRQTNCLDKTERRCPYLNIIMISRSSLQLIAALDAPKRGQKFVRLVWIAKLQCCGSYSALNGDGTSFDAFDAFDGLILCLTPPFTEAMNVTHNIFPIAYLAHSHVWELRRMQRHPPQ